MRLHWHGHGCVEEKWRQCWRQASVHIYESYEADQIFCIVRPIEHHTNRVFQQRHMDTDNKYFCKLERLAKHMGHPNEYPAN